MNVKFHATGAALATILATAACAGRVAADVPHASMPRGHGGTAALASSTPLTELVAGARPPVQAQGVGAQDTTVAAGAAGFRVYLVTVGQGDEVWEKFGHNAIWLLDESGSVNVAYNWGIFDFDAPGYYGRLMKGDMLYSMEGYDGGRMINFYVSSNRSVWAQELNFTDAEKLELKAFLETNSLEENKYYLYDYYRDNCSTRVRDAIDRVLGGTLRAQLEGQPTGTTYRWHTNRTTADVVPAYTGLLLALGPLVDQPIDAWQETFLPVQLMEHVSTLTITAPDGTTRPLVLSERQLFGATRTAERGQPPRRLPYYIAAGLVFAGFLLLLDRASSKRRIAAVLFFTLALAWSLVAGIFGTIIAALWALTHHEVTYRNENVMQVNVLSFVLFVQLILVARGRARIAAARMAAALAVLSAIGLLMTLLPWFPQANGPIVALALPVHLALALALWRRMEERPPVARPAIAAKKKAA